MRVRSIIFGIMLILLCGPVYSETPVNSGMTASSVTENIIYITAGTSRLIKMDFDIRNMAVGDPLIGDVLIMSKREILVNGKLPGITTVTLWDQGQNYDYHLIVNKSSESMVFKRYQLYNIPLVANVIEESGNDKKITRSPVKENIDDLKNILSGYLKPEQYSVNPWTNAILVVASEEEQQLIEKLIKSVDIKQQQVVFKVEVYELKLENNLNYGLEMLYQKDQSNAAFNTIVDGVKVDGFKYTFTSGADLAEAAAHVFKLLLSEGKAKLLATPRILTLNNRYSAIHSGEKYPLVQIDKEGNKTVEYIYTGIILGVVPNINDVGDIDCWILSEASSIAGYDPQYKFPIIRTRSSVNEVRVKDGGLLVLGGLIQENENVTTHKVPILGDLLGWVPVIGGIFKNEETQKVNVEVVVTLRPMVVLDDANTTQLSGVQ